MALSIPPALNSEELAVQFEDFKQGKLTVNEFAMLAISKAAARLRLIFINEGLPFDQFDDVISDLSLSILGVLNTSNLDNIQSPAAYFTKTADNLIIDLIRKLAIQLPTSSRLDEIAIEDCEIDKLDLMEALCLAIYDELDSEIIRLRINGYNQKEIATQLGKAPSVISSRLTKLQMRYEQNIKEI